jgi:hypothetical protein
MNVKTRVHYTGYESDQGQIVATRTVSKVATGGGTGGQNSGHFIGRAEAVEYEVEWDNGTKEWHFKDELVALEG